MKKMNPVTALVALVMALIVCNMGLLATIWFKPGGGMQGCAPAPPPPGGGNPCDFLVHELGFSSQQEHDYDSLIRLHRAAMDSLELRGRQLRMHLYDQLGKSATEPTDELAAIGLNQEAIEQATYRHFVAVRALCSPEQANRFDHVIHAMLDRMHPKGPPPPHDRRIPDGPPGN